MIGFTGLALLGRPGELIRPYLIARHQNLSFASQVAVWTVERIFDVAASRSCWWRQFFFRRSCTLSPRPPLLSCATGIYLTGYALVALVLGLAHRRPADVLPGASIAQWVKSRFSHSPENLGHRIAQKIREFTAGLNTIHGPLHFFNWRRSPS